MREGYEAYLLLVIQMKGITRFEPNWDTHREFGETLQKAKKAGVHILAYDCLEMCIRDRMDRKSVRAVLFVAIIKRL